MSHICFTILRSSVIRVRCVIARFISPSLSVSERILHRIVKSASTLRRSSALSSNRVDGHSHGHCLLASHAKLKMQTWFKGSKIADIRCFLHESCNSYGLSFSLVGLFTLPTITGLRCINDKNVIACQGELPARRGHACTCPPFAPRLHAKLPFATAA